jgi:UDP-GlcNAc:undecaprenyl-phosphate/decaprenyl-phosphate GlcNAc-1-phosphate transferase
MLDVLPLPGNRVAFCILVAFVVAGVVARILTPFAKRIGLADPPGGRKQHSGTIPVTGGIAMFAGFFLAAMVSGLIGGATVALVVALFLLVFGGAADDMHDISPQAKLLIQLVATLLMTSWAGVQVHQLGNLFGFGPLNLYQWAIPFSVICALGVINAINMIDGLDGTAGGVSIVAMLSLAYAALAQGLGTQAVLLALLAAAVTGFLMWNMRCPGIRSQARVFMGDSGSMMLGLALCWFSIDLTQGEGRSLPPIVCMWILAVPLLDMARVMFVRVRKRISMFEADREHLHHLLLERGVPVYATAWIMMGVAALAGAVGLAAWRLGVPDWALSYAFIALFVLVLVTAHFRERAIAREAASAPLTPDWTPDQRLLRARERREQRNGRSVDGL